MISLKSIQTSFTTTKHHVFSQKRELPRKNHTCTLSFTCKSKDSDTDEPDEQPPPQPTGDLGKQEMLVRILQLQAQQVRANEYLDEQSANMIKFKEEKDANYDKIQKELLEKLDQVSAEQWEESEKRMAEWEASAELTRQEILKDEQVLYDFEDQIEKDRNEGLFFQSLKRDKPVDKAQAKEETEKIKVIEKESLGSETRRNIYLGLIGLVSVASVNTWVSATTNWPKAAVLAAILVGLFSQLTYEQNLLSETEGIQEEGKEEEGK